MFVLRPVASQVHVRDVLLQVVCSAMKRLGCRLAILTNTGAGCRGSLQALHLSKICWSVLASLTRCLVSLNVTSYAVNLEACEKSRSMSRASLALIM